MWKNEWVVESIQTGKRFIRSHPGHATYGNEGQLLIRRRGNECPCEEHYQASKYSMWKKGFCQVFMWCMDGRDQNKIVECENMRILCFFYMINDTENKDSSIPMYCLFGIAPVTVEWLDFMITAAIAIRFLIRANNNHRFISVKRFIWNLEAWLGPPLITAVDISEG